jgi:hypothetical protein
MKRDPCGLASAHAAACDKADPAEGNPTSDDPAATVLDADIGEEVACIAGLFQPEVFAAHIDAVGRW